MRLLLTGASSFTGLWFARALAAAGHEVAAPLRGGLEGDALRAARIAEAAQVAEILPDAPFGSPAFLDIVAGGGPFEALCCHGAEARGHKSADFDVEAAVAANTHNAEATFEAFAQAGGRRVVITGSVFEAGEGQGTLPLRAFSPYGLSKTQTASRLTAAAGAAGLEVVKVVIPNPFGPWEGATFQRRIMTAWARGESMHVAYPFYGRDNVPVDLLAGAYLRATEGRLGPHVAPSFWAGPTGDFFRRMAREVAPRTGWACDLTFAQSQTFDEPQVRVNTQPLAPTDHDWSVGAFWDGYARYYSGG